MPEPASTTAATLASAMISTSAITFLGVPLGLRADMLVAGFAGSLVSIILLNTVPPYGDTWHALMRTTVRRMFVSMASSLTAGYLTPMVMLAVALPDPLVMGAAFGTGAGAQKLLMATIARLSTGQNPQGGTQ
ncbi:MAG: hypothetical protein WC829_18945 [Hyphomicrobium sp.]|jgi:hypothetical protein